MLPYFVALTIVWTLTFLAWYVLGLPWGSASGRAGPGPHAVTRRATARNAALTRRTYRRHMDTLAMEAPTRPVAGTAADPHWRIARAAGGIPGHSCAVPGYLLLPDLAMSWKCADCGESWQVVATRRSPGTPLEFEWVRDPDRAMGSPAR
jgi:hypothetical protein